jgi:hypothetical protein
VALLGALTLGDYNIQTSKFCSFRVFLTMNFFILKLMKIRWSSLIFGSFAHHFLIKLNTHGSNFNSTLVSMTELKFFLLIES